MSGGTRKRSRAPEPGTHVDTIINLCTSSDEDEPDIPVQSDQEVVDLDSEPEISQEEREQQEVIFKQIILRNAVEREEVLKVLKSNPELTVPSAESGADSPADPIADGEPETGDAESPIDTNCEADTAQAASDDARASNQLPLPSGDGTEIPSSRSAGQPSTSARASQGKRKYSPDLYFHPGDIPLEEWKEMTWPASKQFDVTCIVAEKIDEYGRRWFIVKYKVHSKANGVLGS